MEDRISQLEDKNFGINQLEENKGKRMKRVEESLHDLWDLIKRTNIGIFGIPEGEEREKRAENLFKS